MSDPYNITQVDIPGIYNAVNQNRMGRIQAMLGERQIQAADRQAERDNNYNTALTRLFAPTPAPGASSGASSASGASPAPASVNPVVAAYGGVPPGAGQPAVTPPGLPGANPAGTPAPPAPPSQMRIDPTAAQALIQADPTRGPQVIHALNEMNAQQLEQAHNRLAALAPIYATVAHIPYGTDGAQRRAYIQSILPQIQQMGIDPNEAAGFDPTDQALNAHMSLGMTMDQAIASARGHPLNVAPGNVTIDTDAIDPATGQPRVIYQSPFVPGPNGEVYPRPQSMDAALPRPRTPQEAARLAPGTRFVDPGGTVRTVPGGPASAPGNFPREDGGAFDFNANP